MYKILYNHSINTSIETTQLFLDTSIISGEEGRKGKWKEEDAETHERRNNVNVETLHVVVKR